MSGNRDPDLFSVFCVRVTPKKRILYCSNFKYFLFLSSPLNPWTFQILRYIWHFHFSFARNLSTIKLALDGID